MPATLDQSSPAQRTTRRARFAVRGLRSMGFGVVIALLLTGGFGTPLLPNLILSVCISTSCWFVIDSDASLTFVG